MKEMLKTIRERHSSRGEFDQNKPVSKDQLETILEAARWSPTAHNMQNFDIIVVDDRKLIETIGKIKSTISEEFIRENFRQLSHSEEELSRKKVGILGAQFPPKWTDASKLDEAIKERAPAPLSYTIRGGQTILLALYDTRKRAPASEGDYLGALSLGCLMENIWLMAEELGISMHIMSAFMADEVQKQLREILGIPSHMRLAFACKLGYPLSKPAKYLRVRREPESFIHYNKF